MADGDPFDVVVVGASIGGCTAARLFALAGARVALVERRPDPDAYKVVCTNQILSSAVPTIERLRLAPLLEARGAVRTQIEAWTPYGGWIRFPPDVPTATASRAKPVATRRRSPLRMLDPRLAPRLAGHLIEPRSIDTRGPPVEHR